MSALKTLAKPRQEKTREDKTSRRRTDIGCRHAAVRVVGGIRGTIRVPDAKNKTNMTKHLSAISPSLYVCSSRACLGNRLCFSYNVFVIRTRMKMDENG
jgi:hypothetical protein